MTVPITVSMTKFWSRKNQLERSDIPQNYLPVRFACIINMYKYEADLDLYERVHGTIIKFIPIKIDTL